ncbi:hypothetical protein EYA82_28205 [Burkholderia pseudomallei]|nr:hypothetical protein EYA82_28205 [Burkholderia pseudomallei]
MPRVGATALLAEPACDEPRLGIFPLRFTLPSNFVERRIFSYPNPCDGPIGKLTRPCPALGSGRSLQRERIDSRRRFASSPVARARGEGRHRSEAAERSALSLRRPGPARFGSAEFSLVRPMPADRGSSGIRRHELEHVRPRAAERHRSPFGDSTGARRRVPGTRRASRQASIDKKTGPPKRARRHVRCAVISSRRLRTTRRSSCARHLSCA